jgi:hypothetical protein
MAPRIAATEPLKVETEHFIDCVLSRRRPRSDASLASSTLTTRNPLTPSLRADGALVPVRYSVKC